jgi:hypothetical protein
LYVVKLSLSAPLAKSPSERAVGDKKFNNAEKLVLPTSVAESLLPMSPVFS